MLATNVYIINHTHWDREWFLTSVYTSRWIPGLIDKLEALAAGNPDFRFLFDGQTLVIEDLLEVAPSYEERIRDLVGEGRLQIGPYYCQPDWQLTCGELLVRNLMYGQQDVARFGGTAKTGWLVDTFGHISQSPQIHRMFDINAVFVWRGVPKLEPYFLWEGADDSWLLTINLFGGYRNLYGVTHVPEVAGQRLEAEVDKLRPFYPTPDLPLFDGYDLESNPEDPLSFYSEAAAIRPDLILHEATPAVFAGEISRKDLELPVIEGELNSGKYGATFPGTFSTRTYLKIMARDCQHLLFQLCEPLAAMAWLKGRAYNGDRYETWGRMLLQNAVHDCICGVSIDQVHEKMEYNYLQVYDGASAEIEDSLGTILSDFAAGDYAISTTPFATEDWQAVEGEWVQIKTDGVGVWPIAKRLPIETADEAVETFSWRNAHYAATVNGDGLVSMDQGSYGELVVFEEHGDTYSDELGERLGLIRPSTPLTVVEKSANHCVIAFDGRWLCEGREVTASVRLQFDQSPLLRWQIDLDSRGTDLRVEMVFKTGRPGHVFAGMPFDVVEREVADADLLPRELSPTLSSVLLGQRELGKVSTFPFHDFVAVDHDDGTTAVLAKGIHSYRATEAGELTLTLRRAVEWLTKADLADRIGDAGPFFYVPDARCERRVRHELALAMVDFAPNSMALQRLNAVYQNPPLIARKQGTGEQTEWPLLQENLPLSSLRLEDEALLTRFYNPTGDEQSFKQSWSHDGQNGSQVLPKEVVTARLEAGPVGASDDQAVVSLLMAPEWRVGDNEGLPDTAVLAQLEQTIVELGEQVAAVREQLSNSEGDEKLRLQHKMYVQDRERLESLLSLILNQRKLAVEGKLDEAYLFEPDKEIAAVGFDLNQLRTKRRIFDYVIESLD